MAGPTATTPDLWLKADAGVYSDAGTTLATDTQSVQQWNDQSGNSRHLSQGTSGKRPVYRTSQYNTLPCIRFDGTDDFLDSATFAAALSQPNTIFIVAKLSSTTGFRTLIDTNTGSNEHAWLWNGTQFTQYAGTNRLGTEGSADTLMAHVWETFWSGASSYVKQDRHATTIIAAGSVGTQTLPNLRLGSNPTPGSYFSGDMMEVLVYNTTLSAGETTQVREYLMARWSQVYPTSGYVLYAFGTLSQTALKIANSSDGVTWTAYNATYYATAVETVRDPSIYRVSSTSYWLATTKAGIATKTTSFAVAESTDGFTFWKVADVDCSAVSGNTNASRTWAPEWFVDPADGSVHVFFAASPTGDVDTGFQLYETHPTNAAYTTWSAPVAVTGTSLPANMIDPFMVKIGATYYLWYKEETGKYIEVLSSSSLTSGYTVLRSGDWMGIGSTVEGPAVIQVAGAWRLYCSRYSANLISYTDQTAGDWKSGSTTWNALAYISPASTYDHGMVILPGNRRRRVLCGRAA